MDGGGHLALAHEPIGTRTKHDVFEVAVLNHDRAGIFERIVGQVLSKPVSASLGHWCTAYGKAAVVELKVTHCISPQLPRRQAGESAGPSDRDVNMAGCGVFVKCKMKLNAGRATTRAFEALAATRPHFGAATMIAAIALQFNQCRQLAHIAAILRHKRKGLGAQLILGQFRVIVLNDRASKTTSIVNFLLP